MLWARARRAARLGRLTLQIVQDGLDTGEKSGLAAADELHDFEPIALRQMRFGPLRPRQDFQVALNRDAPGVEA